MLPGYYGKPRTLEYYKHTISSVQFSIDKKNIKDSLVTWNDFAIINSDLDAFKMVNCGDKKTNDYFLLRVSCNMNG